MRNLLLCTAVLASASMGCSSSSSHSDGGIIGETDGGDLDAGASFQVTQLTVAGNGPNLKLAAAISSDGRIGIAYYTVLDGGDVDRTLEYLELETDGSTRAFQIAGPNASEGPIRRTTQVSVGFGADGTAYVGYFAKDPNNNEAIYSNDPDGGGDLFWYQSDLGIASIGPTATSVTHDYPIHQSTDIPDRTGGIDVGQINGVVGYNPAVMVLPTQVQVISRDLHAGQFPVQDYGDSDVEAVIGTAGSWAAHMVQQGSDNGGNVGPDAVHAGLGALPSAAASSDGTLAGVAYTSENDLDAKDQFIYFSNYVSGAWSPAKEIFTSRDGNAGNVGGNAHGGPALAADPTAGFGLAWTDYSASILHYATSADGVAWSSAEDAFGSGTGGWYPSLAFDPTTHLPAVAYYVCSLSPSAQSCNTADDELRVSLRKPNGKWYVSTVDPEGGVFPVLLFNGGQMVVVYRDMAQGGLKIARQVQ